MYWALWSNISTLVSSVQRTLFQKSWCLFRCNFTNLSCAAMFFLERRRFLLQPIQTIHTCSVFSLIVLPWTVTFNMLTEACRVWDAVCGLFCSFSEYYTVWPWGELARTSPAEKIGNCLRCFPFSVWILFLTAEWWTLNCLHVLTTPPSLMGSNSCFSMIIADVFPPWHCVAHLNAPDQQNDSMTLL